MKTLGIAGAATLVLLLGNSVPGYPQEQQEHAKPPQQQEPKPTTPPRAQDEEQPQRATPRPEAGRDERAPQQEQKQEQRQERDQEKRAQDEAKKAQQQEQKVQEEQGRREQEDQGRRAQQEQSRQAQRPAETGRVPSAAGNRGARIPEDHFRAHFGREHHFLINRPVIIDNRPRFQYSGYWFEIIDPWPSDWSYRDECYIDYLDDGYYLFDPYHPGMRLAIVLVM
jgi:hypothetical protein